MLPGTEEEREAVVGYYLSQSPGAEVTFLQKVYAESILGHRHDVWDVHASDGRWWVITNPTNLYSQAQFPNMDLAGWWFATDSPLEGGGFDHRYPVEKTTFRDAQFRSLCNSLSHRNRALSRQESIQQRGPSGGVTTASTTCQKGVVPAPPTSPPATTHRSSCCTAQSRETERCAREIPCSVDRRVQS
jgi:hypothetical protein